MAVQKFEKSDREERKKEVDGIIINKRKKPEDFNILRFTQTNNKQKKKKGDFNTLRFTQTNKALAPLLLIVGG